MNTSLKSFLIASAVYGALAGLWAVATPISAVPDEPSHMIRAAAVVRGDIITEAWAEFPAYAGVEVPGYVSNTASVACFAFAPEVTPDCAQPGLLDSSLSAPTTTGTSAALNSPLYYALVGWPTLILSGEVALYGMRIANVLIFAALMGLAFSQLRRIVPEGRWSVVGIAAASTPMLIFLGGSVNPNGVEAAGTLGLYLLLLSSLRTPPTGAWRWVTPPLIAVVAALVMNTRSIGILWVVVVTLVAISQTGWRSFLSALRSKWMATIAALGVLTGLLSVGWLLLLPDYDQSLIPTNDYGPLYAFIRVTLGVFEDGYGLVGLFGWLDTPSPAFTAFSMAAIGLGLVLLAYATTRGINRWIPVVFLALVVVVPAVIQTVIASELGYIWQGRYLLAMYVCAIVAAGIALDAERVQLEIPRRARGVTVATLCLALLALSHWVVFIHVLKRYVVGSDATYLDMISNPDWQPPGSWPVLWAAYGAALAVGFLLARRDGVRHPSDLVLGSSARS